MSFVCGDANLREPQTASYQLEVLIQLDLLENHVTYTLVLRPSASRPHTNFMPSTIVCLTAFAT
jgi:hypothetical protein